MAALGAENSLRRPRVNMSLNALSDAFAYGGGHVADGVFRAIDHVVYNVFAHRRDFIGDVPSDRAHECVFADRASDGQQRQPDKSAPEIAGRLKTAERREKTPNADYRKYQAHAGH